MIFMIMTKNLLYEIEKILDLTDNEKLIVEKLNNLFKELKSVSIDESSLIIKSIDNRISDKIIYYTFKLNGKVLEIFQEIQSYFQEQYELLVDDKKLKRGILYKTLYDKFLKRESYNHYYNSNNDLWNYDITVILEKISNNTVKLESTFPKCFNFSNIKNILYQNICNDVGYISMYFDDRYYFTNNSIELNPNFYYVIRNKFFIVFSNKYRINSIVHILKKLFKKEIQSFNLFESINTKIYIDNNLQPKLLELEDDELDYLIKKSRA